MALSSSSSFTCDWTYDVFLNFRGVDTRNNFTGNLYNSLCQKGIETFIDDEGLNKGEEITPSLLQAIDESRIFISIFSENYASSTYCLDELVKILACSKARERLFMPIFYDVNPSQVRHQTGSYAEALAKHEERFQDRKDKVQEWREALSQAADMSGWHFELGSQPEYKFSANIIKKVSKIINHTPLYVAENLVGLDTPLLEVTSLLELDYDDGVNMVGIYGIGGVGKSTIARAIYNLIADQFEGVCFLADLRKKDLTQLQEILLSDILGEEDIKVRDVNRGISMIKRRLHRKKVLLILDDVDKLKQLQVLVGGHDWFGLGSKIIITTRDKHLLNTHGVEKSYEVKQLNDEKALELFSWHAFKRNKIDPSYADISKRAISYVHGLPLALEVIGSHLFGKSLAIWKSALDKYERILHKDICEVLEVSYKDLEEDEKAIFLDIACFFNSYQISYVKEILYVRGFYVENGIQVLIDKSLIKIDCNHCIVMHDLIQDMGREIVRRESSEPGKRSRLWFYEDVVRVLEENKGTDSTEVIIVDLYKVKEVKWNGMGFKMMKNLRILIMANVHFSEEPQNLPNSLRMLEWNGYLYPSLPFDFEPKNLSIISLPESCPKSFKLPKVFKSLSFMNFEGCESLTELPSLSEAPNLLALCLDYCTNLVRISTSVGFLKRLTILSVQGCTKLQILVPCINLASLETLNLTGCSSLESFPEVWGIMEAIKEIYLDHTAIRELPFSIGNLVGLQRLFLRECQLIQLPSSIHQLPSLEVITTYGCGGFRFSKDKEKMSSTVFPEAMLVWDDEGRYYFLDMCYVCPNNDIEVSVPRKSLGSVFMNRLGMREEWIKQESKESSIWFWFRNKFPRVSIICAGEPGTYKDNMVLDFKVSVLINETKQFISSCNFIISRKRMIKGQILVFELSCREEKEFIGHEWKQLKILCGLEYPIPCSSKRMVMVNEDEIVMRMTTWSFIYVDEENKKDVIFPSEYLRRCTKGPRELENIFIKRFILSRIPEYFFV